MTQKSRGVGSETLSFLKEKNEREMDFIQNELEFRKKEYEEEKKKARRSREKAGQYDANVCPEESANDIVNLKTG